MQQAAAAAGAAGKFGRVLRWAGAALRAVLDDTAKLLPWLAAAGAGLACAYVTREDAGLFLLPFAGAATIIVLVVLAVLAVVAVRVVMGFFRH